MESLSHSNPQQYKMSISRFLLCSCLRDGRAGISSVGIMVISAGEILPFTIARILRLSIFRFECDLGYVLLTLFFNTICVSSLSNLGVICVVAVWRNNCSMLDVCYRFVRIILYHQQAHKIPLTPSLSDSVQQF